MTIHASSRFLVVCKHLITKKRTLFLQSAIKRCHLWQQNTKKYPQKNKIATATIPSTISQAISRRHPTISHQRGFTTTKDAHQRHSPKIAPPQVKPIFTSRSAFTNNPAANLHESMSSIKTKLPTCNSHEQWLSMPSRSKYCPYKSKDRQLQAFKPTVLSQQSYANSALTGQPVDYCRWVARNSISSTHLLQRCNGKWMGDRH